MADLKLAEVLIRHQAEIAADWAREQTAAGVVRGGLISERELRSQCEEFLELLASALRGGNIEAAASQAPLRELLGRISRTRGEAGLTPSETATFVFSLKQPLFTRLRRELEKSPAGSSTRSGRPRSCSTASACTRPRCTRRAARRSSRASSRRCSSCRRRWSSCGTASSRCR